MLDVFVHVCVCKLKNMYIFKYIYLKKTNNDNTGTEQNQLNTIFICCRWTSEVLPGVTLAVFVLALPAEPEDASGSAKKLIRVDSVQAELQRIPGPERQCLCSDIP